PDVHAQLPDWIEGIVAGVCQTYGVTYEVNYQRRVSSVMNETGLTHLVADCAKAALGDSQVEWIDEPSLGAEDFAIYTDKAPGMMFRLGVGFNDRPNYPLHHPRFDVDETAIKAGVMTMALSACQYWQRSR
ncbi:MAG: M20/M25/M40 family metallo-hydrolase, partial [Cyanobacteria bacterium J06632_22]